MMYSLNILKLTKGKEMTKTNFLIDTSGSMGEQAKLVIVRDVAKTLNLYHLIGDISISLDIYKWNEFIESCSLEDVERLVCKGRPNFKQVIEFLSNLDSEIVFLVTDGGFSKSELDFFNKIKDKLQHVYLVIIGNEEISMLKNNELFKGKIFSSGNIYDLISVLDTPSEKEVGVNDDWE